MTCTKFHRFFCLYIQKTLSDILTQKAEIKFTGFLAEHDLPISSADQDSWLNIISQYHQLIRILGWIWSPNIISWSGFLAEHDILVSSADQDSWLNMISWYGQLIRILGWTWSPNIVSWSGFLVEHDLPISSADHLSGLVKECFTLNLAKVLFMCKDNKVLHFKSSCLDLIYNNHW